MKKSVFISGAASGIGLITAKKLLELGWVVYAADLPTSDFSILPHAIPLPFDIRDKHAIQAAIHDIKSLDALVNNAGIQIAAHQKSGCAGE